jgi:hypothetical protein
VIKSAPAVSKIDVTFLNGTAAGLGGGATAKRTTDTIFVVHLSVRRDKLRVLLLNEMKFVENVQFIVPGETWCAQTGAEGWAMKALGGGMTLNQAAYPQFDLKARGRDGAEWSEVIHFAMFILTLPRRGMIM